MPPVVAKRARRGDRALLHRRRRGAGLYELRPSERSVFASRTNGFEVLDADDLRLSVSLVDGTGKAIFEETLRKDPPTSTPGR